CDGKGIHVSTEYMASTFNLRRISSTIQINQNYSIDPMYNYNRVQISRIFNQTNYIIILENYNLDNAHITGKFNVHLERHKGAYDGEECIVPNQRIWHNYTNMINDIPFTLSQKRQILDNTYVIDI